MQEHPVESNKPRRKRRQPATYPRNIRKRSRLEGKEYLSTKSVLVPAAQMKPPCKETCKLKCFTIPNGDRLKIFEAYYKIADYARQRDFINANTEKHRKATKTVGEISRRNFSMAYFLPLDGTKRKVCKPMFLNTLGIKKGIVDIAMKKRSKQNVTSSDGRGKGKSKTLDLAIIEDIKTHIKSFPCVASHYVRADTSRKYLDSCLNLATMYRLYDQWCIQNKRPKAKLSAYRNIFNNNFNLGFHRPKKDQCRVCVAFENDNNSTEEMKKDYQIHLEKKQEAREAKKQDKENAMENQNILSCNFDLQQVLMCPSDPTNNALFYKRRLFMYNFTIYNVVNKEGDCFMWHEGQGGRGSCEIASLLFKYFESLPHTVEDIRCFSDRCGGQNLNKYVVAMCMYAVQKIENLKIIHLKFLTSGHSEMECDSMHSAIGTEFKRIGKALWPGDWKTIARSARKKGDKPYKVHDIETKDFYDWKEFAENNMTIRKMDTENKPVLFQKICWFQFKKENRFEFEFKKSFKEENFRRVDCSKKAQSHPLTEAKYNDLMSLFSIKPSALSQDYYTFYCNLPHGRPDDDDD